MTPHRATGPHDWPALLHLIRTAFAGMEGRIDPPSSIHALIADRIARQAREGEVWVVGLPAVACLFLTPTPCALHLEKLAVAAAHRGQGLARALIGQAETRARALGLLAMSFRRVSNWSKTTPPFGRSASPRPAAAPIPATTGRLL